MPVLPLRAFAVWLLVIAAETVHGVLPTLLLAPLVGDLPARQVGVPAGSLLILAVACLCTRWIDPGRSSRLSASGCCGPC